MPFYKRDLTKTLKRFAKFPVLALLGPRQSGKTTLVRNVFKKHAFVSMENPEMREFANKDPNGFLREYGNDSGIILDEFQHTPQILSYIQIAVDEKKRPGYFILTGSQNFLVNQAITQTLAGRVGILTLLPLSQHELSANKLDSDINKTIFRGGYPRLYAEHYAPEELYPSYVHSYVERDVRQLVNVGNLRNFQNFMQLCAGRVGQLLNLNDLATNCGISRKTADSWLSLLEASYIVFLLRPHFNNFNKRITKTPKLYFFDTGLACSLLGIKSATDVQTSPFRGHLFECMIISDFYKQFYNMGAQPPLYFWRDKNGRIEVDCLVAQSNKLIPIEIKSGETVVNDFFISLSTWNSLAKVAPENGYLVYGGQLAQKRSVGNVVGWQAADDLMSKLTKKK